MASSSVIEQGMAILRSRGEWLEPADEEMAETSDQEAGEPAPLEVIKALTDQLQAMTDRLSLADAVATMSTQIGVLTSMCEQLCILVTQPRIKVPIRDEAGRIIEVRELVQTPASPYMGDQMDCTDGY